MLTSFRPSFSSVPASSAFSRCSPSFSSASRAVGFGTDHVVVGNKADITLVQATVKQLNDGRPPAQRAKVTQLPSYLEPSDTVRAIRIVGPSSFLPSGRLPSATAAKKKPYPPGAYLEGLERKTITIA